MIFISGFLIGFGISVFILRPKTFADILAIAIGCALGAGLWTFFITSII